MTTEELLTAILSKIHAITNDVEELRKQTRELVKISEKQLRHLREMARD